MRCVALLASLTLSVAMLLLGAGCGSDEDDSDSDRDTFILAVINMGKKSEPEELIFSVNGDLTAEELEWSGWGEPSATATGTFLVRDAERGGSVPVEGTLEVSDLIVCRGANYYRAGAAKLPPDAPFQPQPLSFATPCDRGASVPPPSEPSTDEIDPTPENQDGVPSGEFESDDIERTENADLLVELYCSADPASEAQEVGCLSHVTVDIVCEQDTDAKIAAVEDYIAQTGDEAICE